MFIKKGTGIFPIPFFMTLHVALVFLVVGGKARKTFLRAK
jgi:hypothetical protein